MSYLSDDGLVVGHQTNGRRACGATLVSLLIGVALGGLLLASLVDFSVAHSRLALALSAEHRHSNRQLQLAE